MKKAIVSRTKGRWAIWSKCITYCELFGSREMTPPKSDIPASAKLYCFEEYQ